ncbi:MAG: TetR/AcrR family transcriptional regulator [Mycobacterium sp.]
MAELGAALPGLRERKKQRTRATLIDAAVELCLRQGYEQTTVEQIAAAADVSPRTFSRYFATKDAVVMTLVDDLVEAVNVELLTIAREVPELEALRLAHVRVLLRAATGAVGRLNDERVVLMLRIINASPALKSAATDMRENPMNALAHRMGVAVDDKRLALVGAVWSSIIVTACGDLVDDCDGVRLGAQAMVDRINETFGWFADMTEGVPKRTDCRQGAPAHGC